MISNMMDLLRSDGSIVVNKKLAKNIGLDEAIIYSELASQFNFWNMKGEMVDENGKKNQNGEWFFCTVEKLEEHTTIKKGRQNRTIQSLEKLNLIEVKKMGLPAKRYFKMTGEIFNVLMGDKSNQNEPTDNSKGSEGKNEEKAEKARSNQSNQNEPTRETKMSQLDEPKRATINNRSINTVFSNNDLNIEEEEGAYALLSAFKKNINSNAGDSIHKSFDHWLQVLPFDVILNEIEYAAKTGGHSFAYLEKALIQDKNKGVANLLDLENKRIEYAASKQASKKKHTRSAQKPVREEVLPEWFTDKEKQEEAAEEPTEAKKQALELEKAKMLEKLAAKRNRNAERGV